tara:strand:- start:211 stop:498 length:288 start_codon:yes stop_codon:yes gene_type:complete
LSTIGQQNLHLGLGVCYTPIGKKVMEIDEDKKIAKILKKVNKNKPQFGLGQVPQYGKSRSGREYGGFIKESTYNKMKYKATNRGRNIVKKGPYEI